MTPAERQLRIYRFCQLACWLFLTCWNRLAIRGVRNVPREGGCIIAANHASFLDPPVIGASLIGRRVARFMARDTLFKKGFPSWLLTNLATVAISRDKGDLAALKTSIRVLKEGGCLGVFPEGTRTHDGALQAAKGGIGFLIAKASVPVVPVYVDGTFAAYPRGAKGIRPAKVRIAFGAPVQPGEIAALGEGRDMYEKAAALVMARIAALRDECAGT